MLLELNIKNLALISRADLSFDKGMHVLTGETGAGKSMLLGAMDLALGGRASADMIRQGQDEAYAELVFDVSGDESLTEKLNELDIAPDEEGTIILSRKISGSKKGSCKINGETATISKLKAVADLLIDIHGQHEHQSLLNRSNHIKILDGFVPVKDRGVFDELKNAYGQYRELRDRLENEKSDEAQRERELSYMRHELNEIESAALKPGEDDEVQERYDLISNGKRITDALSKAGELLGAGEGNAMLRETPALDRVGEAIGEISAVAEYAPALESLADMLRDAESILSDACHELSGHMASFDFDEGALNECTQRLDLINTLKKRYGSTIDEINSYAEDLRVKCERYEDYEAYISSLQADVEKSEGKLKDLCARASKLRKKAALELEKKMKEELSDLNFLSADFRADIKKREDYTAAGYDIVEFMISMNPGEPLKSLSQVASGGELSRIMLALRTIGDADDGIGTLIFDEIDAGISGVTAMMVARKLSDLSKKRQVICITHLAQIAAFGDHHFYIEKSASDNVTTTRVELLGEEERIGELTRLLGGTASAGATAAELMETAAQYRK